MTFSYMYGLLIKKQAACSCKLGRIDYDTSLGLQCLLFNDFDDRQTTKNDSLYSIHRTSKTKNFQT